MIDDEVKALLDAMREENAEARQENAAMHAAARQENAAMRQENAAMHAETQRHVDIVVERMEGRFELLAETVQLVNENLQTQIVALDRKIDKTTAETQGLVKFLYDDLNRRVVVIEGKLGSRK
jgi:DNA polymerase II large subunit